MNQAVEILGIQMRTTEDALTRNVLASTAGSINCTGGGNGKITNMKKNIVAVLKSSLIDLETEA